jgi:predicted phage terminase large subunit-like protein
LIGYDAKGVVDKRDKLTRAKAFAVQSEAGNVKVLARDWTENFLNHLHGQPDLDHDDIMDGSSGAFNVLHSEKGWSGSY